jgi:xanthine dehydrogenase accessory factor
MVVQSDGSIIGSVGGGALEGACCTKAQELLADSATFALLDFQLTAASAAEEGMACGGSASVLLQRIDPVMLSFFQRLLSEYHCGRRPMLLTILPKDREEPRLLLLDSQNSPDLPSELRLEISRKGRRAPFLLDSQGMEIFVEPLVHPGTVHLAGAGHVALAVAELANFVGFQIVVMDDRREFANSARYPKAREVRVLDSFAACLQDLGADDYVVIVTRGHLHDREVLAQALRTKAGYIGMIGSRRKRAAVYESLRGDGWTDTDLARVHCPIGLAIDADTPEEIALSIVAEMVQVRAKMAV